MAHVFHKSTLRGMFGWEREWRKKRWSSAIFSPSLPKIDLSKSGRKYKRECEALVGRNCPWFFPSKFQYFSLSLSSLPFLFVFVLLCFICFFYSLSSSFFDRTVLVLVYICVCRVFDQGLCSFLGGIYIQFLFIYKKVLHFN